MVLVERVRADAVALATTFSPFAPALFAELVEGDGYPPRVAATIAASVAEFRIELPPRS